MPDPVLGKSPPRPRWDNKLMTWSRFLKLRKWAKTVYERTGYHVYLVGSVLTKARPRDIDIAVLVPDAEYRAKYGDTLPGRDDPNRDAWFKDNFPFYHEAMDAITWKVTFVDVKLCSDAWWPEKDRLLLY